MYEQIAAFEWVHGKVVHATCAMRPTVILSVSHMGDLLRLDGNAISQAVDLQIQPLAEQWLALGQDRYSRVDTTGQR